MKPKLSTPYVLVSAGTANFQLDSVAAWLEVHAQRQPSVQCDFAHYYSCDMSITPLVLLDLLSRVQAHFFALVNILPLASTRDRSTTASVLGQTRLGLDDATANDCGRIQYSNKVVEVAWWFLALSLTAEKTPVQKILIFPEDSGGDRESGPSSTWALKWGKLGGAQLSSATSPELAKPQISRRQSPVLWPDATELSLCVRSSAYGRGDRGRLLIQALHLSLRGYFGRGCSARYLLSLATWPSGTGLRYSPRGPLCVLFCGPLRRHRSVRFLAHCLCSLSIGQRGFSHALSCATLLQFLARSTTSSLGTPSKLPWLDSRTSIASSCVTWHRQWQWVPGLQVQVQRLRGSRTPRKRPWSIDRGEVGMAMPFLVAFFWTARRDVASEVQTLVEEGGGG